jgi:uncharacterized protein (TIGR00251 family)
MPSAADPSWISPRPDGVRLSVKVTPCAARSGIAGIAADADGRSYLAVRVTAPPEAGKATAELIKLLARRLGLAASGLHLVSGASTRRKVVQVDGRPEEMRDRLRAILIPD